MPRFPLSAPFLQPIASCRPALPLDTLAALELAGHIWNGHDYILYVWADWLADPRGLLAVAEMGGRLAGLGKLTEVGANEWWLEGLRVHPDLEGRGVAGHMFDYLLDTAAQRGGGSIRLITASFRVKIHHLAERCGFAKRAETIYLHAPQLPGETHGLRPLTLDECGDAFTRAAGSDTLPLTGGLMDIGWKYAALSRAQLQRAAANGQAFDWQNGRGVVTGWEDEDDGERLWVIGLLACDRAGLAQCLHDTRRLAGILGFDKVFWSAPLQPGLEAVYQSVGFTRQWEHEIWLFEKHF